MAIDDDSAVTVAAETLGVAGAFIPGPVGIVLVALSKIAVPVYDAVKGGSSGEDIVKAVKASLVAAADAEMKATLGP